MLQTNNLIKNKTFQMIVEAKREATLLAHAELEFLKTSKRQDASLPMMEKYRILEEIRRGAQGIVYRATPQNGKTPLAIKVLLSGCTPSDVQLQRFEREIELLQQLDHPGIVSILDHGIVDGRHFFVMPLIDGLPLNKAAELHALTLDEKVQWIARITEAVEAAHRIGVIHRDLKPSNVLVSPEGDVHLIDFGLAAQFFDDQYSPDSADTALTLTGQFIGSLPWSSPEHASCETSRIDVRSDVYSLGVLLYQLVTGVLPYPSEGGPLALLDRIKNEIPDPPRTLDPRIPKDLETIIQKCLSKDPDRRYQSAGQLKKELYRWRAGEAIEARRESAIYVISQAMKKHPFASLLIVASWLGGILLGGTMTGMYQQAVGQATVVKSENDQLKQQLSELQQRVVKPRSWMSAIETADDLRTMSPAVGWKFMQETWAKLDTVDTKQQFLKAIAFSNHAYSHRGLHFGMQDASPKVQAWASGYLSELAFFEVAEDVNRYAQWQKGNAQHTQNEVLAASVARVAEDIKTAQHQQDNHKLAMYLRCVSQNSELRSSDAIKSVIDDSGLAMRVLKVLSSEAKDLAKIAGRAIMNLPLDESFIKQHIAPLIQEDCNYHERLAAIQLLGRVQADWATDILLDLLTKTMDLPRGSPAELWTVASALAEQSNPRVIPTMIAMIEAENTEKTIYGLGYYGLGKLTGVKYDESHDGAWWRKWWEENQQRFQLSALDAKIPVAKLAQQPTAKKTATKVTNDVKYATNDDMAKYILHCEGSAITEPPQEGYKLLFILPGGDGSAEFRGFCENIAKTSTDETFLVAQLIAPVWNQAKAQKLVWPTRRDKYRQVRFPTEEHAAMVLKDIRQKYAIDKSHIYTMSWSSGGPAAYALSLAKDLPITGSFIAMSIYRPQELPPRNAAQGKAYYLLHSPQDFIQMRFPENAKRQLEAAGAHVKLQTYQGGHGWHGDVMGNIRRAIAWLQDNK